MTAGHKSYSLAAENELELQDWLSKLNSVLQQNKAQEEKRAASLERGMHIYNIIRWCMMPDNIHMYRKMKYKRESKFILVIN
jgi:REP element-mobilizing transposase RayT